MSRGNDLVRNVRGRNVLGAIRSGPKKSGAKHPGPKCKGAKRPGPNCLGGGGANLLGPKYQGVKRPCPKCQGANCPVQKVRGETSWSKKSESKTSGCENTS